MMNRAGWSAMALAFVVVSAVSLGSPAVAGETYNVDTVHSTVLFRVKHMNTSWAYGRFNDVGGTIVLDDDPSQCKFDIRVKAASVDTANEKRDQHLRGVDLLNSAQFPEMTFQSTKVAERVAAAGAKKKAASPGLSVTGDLTFHGVTRPVTVTFQRSGSGKDMQGNPIVGLEATFMIKRSDYGMKEMLGALGDNVRLTVAIEASRAKP